MNSNLTYNTFTRIKQSLENQLSNPRKFSTGVDKVAKVAKFLRGSRGPGHSTISSMIGHDVQTPSYTLKHLATLATLSTSAKTLRRRTNRNSITSKLSNLRGNTASQNPWNSASSKLSNLHGDFPRVAKLVWHTVCIPSINSNVKLNTFTRIEQSPENQLYRPRKISIGSVKLSYRENPRVLRRGSSARSVKSVESVGLFRV